MTTTQWGRKETIVRPPHAPVYSFTAAFAALILTCLFVSLYIGFLMPTLQRWYLPLYLRTGVVVMVCKVDTYQLLNVADAHLHARPATEADVQKGSTPQPNRRPLPLALSDSAHVSGMVYLYPGPKTSYRNAPLHVCLQRFFYGGQGVVGVLRWPLFAGFASFLGLLIFAVRKDVERLKEMKYGRLLKGQCWYRQKDSIVPSRAMASASNGFATSHCLRNGITR